MNFIKKYIPIDLFSKKRFVSNIVIFSSYTLIFSLSFISSDYLASKIRSYPYHNFTFYLNILPLIIGIKFIVFNFFNFRRILLLYYTFYNFFKSIVLVLLSGLALIFLGLFVEILSNVSLMVFAFDALISLGAILSVHSFIYFSYRKLNFYYNGKQNCRALIIGTGEAAVILCKSIQNSMNTNYFIVGFVEDDLKNIGFRLQGKKIYGPIENLLEIAKESRAKKVIIALPSAPPRKIHQIVESIKDTDIEVSTVPSYLGIINGDIKIDNIRALNIDDLLEREKIKINMEGTFSNYVNKSILITGAAGSIGSEICRQILKVNPKELITLDQAETSLFYLEKELNTLKNNTRIVPIIADITNDFRISSIFRRFKPDIVFHAAAYKHVPMMENNKEESILNNVLGTKIVADNANDFNAELFIMISTDKAVNPSSVMGLTKRITETYIQSLNQVSLTNYFTVCFGNVLDSSGNVINIFKEQIANGGPVTITHPEMKRYFMLNSEAVNLVIQAGVIGKGGEIFLLNMGEPVKILDLAKSMIKISGYEVDKEIKILFTDVRPGEKLFEELWYDDESVCKTSNPQIFVCKSRKYNWDIINTQINELLNNIYNSERVNIILNDIVPEYKNGHKILKHVDEDVLS